MSASRYFVVFDVSDHGRCNPDPDVAGIGAVVSFIVASIATMVVSILAAILDVILRNEHAIYERKPETRTDEAASTTKTRNGIFGKSWEFWRRLLDPTMLALADQQIITGMSLLISGYIREYARLQGAHFSLVVFMSCLSSSSHLACVITLREYFKNHRTIAILRVFLIATFAILLCVSIDASRAFYFFFQILFDTIYILTIPYSSTIYPVLFILYLFWTALLQLSLFERVKIKMQSWIRTALWKRIRKWTRFDKAWRPCVLRFPKLQRLSKILKRVFWIMLFLNRFIVFGLQILFALFSIAFVLMQKFAPAPQVSDAPWHPYLCDLSDAAENEWGFGQLLPMILLVLPVLSFVETYNELRDEEMAAITQKSAPTAEASILGDCPSPSSDNQRTSGDTGLASSDGQSTSQASNLSSHHQPNSSEYSPSSESSPHNPENIALTSTPSRIRPPSIATSITSAVTAQEEPIVSSPKSIIASEEGQELRELPSASMPSPEEDVNKGASLWRWRGQSRQDTEARIGSSIGPERKDSAMSTALE